MAFMTLKTIVFKNKKTFYFLKNSFLLISVYLLPSLANYRSNMTLLLSIEGASVQNLMLF